MILGVPKFEPNLRLVLVTSFRLFSEIIYSKPQGKKDLRSHKALASRQTLHFFDKSRLIHCTNYDGMLLNRGPWKFQKIAFIAALHSISTK